MAEVALSIWVWPITPREGTEGRELRGTGNWGTEGQSDPPHRIFILCAIPERTAASQRTSLAEPFLLLRAR